MSTPPPVTLAAGGTEARFDLARGGRLASLAIDGLEVLVQEEADPMRWGSYPMAPWAGRVAHGRFDFAGTSHLLPLGLPPHAIHGTAYTSAWERRADGAMVVRLGPPWPFPARLIQEAELGADALSVRLTLEAEVDQPAMLGWHPWFRRRLDDDNGGVGVRLDVEPGAMYELDDEAIPTGRLVRPGPQPWDNCFVDLARPPRLAWPGGLGLTVESDCRHWVLFTEPEHAVCVEPQTDAPDAFNREAPVVAGGERLTATMTLRWS